MNIYSKGIYLHIESEELRNTVTKKLKVSYVNKEKTLLVALKLGIFYRSSKAFML